MHTMNKKFRSLILAAVSLASLGFASLASRAAVETYAIDSVHSNVAFSIRHFVSKVPGNFTKLSGTIKVDRENLEKSTVNAIIDVSSVTTSNDARDKHLKSDAFFDVAKYPTARFVSIAWKKTGENTFDITGDLTIHGITKSVVLNAELLGFGAGMEGVQLSGWQATTTLKRSDFGMSGPAVLGAALGDEVAITINVEADLKK